MKLELTPNEIIYRFDAKLGELKDRVINNLPEYRDVYKKIRTAIGINKEGYNAYLIDDFTQEKLEAVICFIKTLYSGSPKPKDICYAVYRDEKRPKVIFMSNGRGHELKETLEELQELYAEVTVKFYNGSGNKDKESLVQNIQRKRAELVSGLISMAKNQGFDVRPTTTGFSFVPLKEGEGMTEKDFDELEPAVKGEIMTKVGKLKEEAQDILEELRNMEKESVTKIKEIMSLHYKEAMKEKRYEIRERFCSEKDALQYLDFICDEMERGIIDIYSTNYQDDEEKLGRVIKRFLVKIIADNRENDTPLVFFEEDPSVHNLIGNIEYENHNGSYITDASLIKGGSLLKSNEGCVIIRVNSLLSNPSAYYYLKKTLLSSKVNFDINRGYLELLSLGGLKPDPVDINIKVILIGDAETYDILYSYDEDFKKLFKIRAEYNPVVDNTDESKLILIDNIVKLVTKNKLNPLTDEAIKETAKYLSRKAGDRRKLLFNNEELSRILFVSDQKARNEGRSKIESRDIAETLYSKEILEKEVLEFYRDNRIIFDTNAEIAGSVNGLSVIDTGYLSFGKPIRITCTCYKGEGNIIDVQKESNLSGNIHSKSVNILTGYLNRILGGYSRLPVDFHLSFEQTYGKIDGDSASVAEIICMISALSRIPVRQNIAVTGSINQFGEVQPIGGVNEKIEGFFNVCSLKGDCSSKGVLIPYLNKEDIVLNSEVEAAVSRGEFHIYVMSAVEDAVTVLMADEKHTTEDIFGLMEKEIKKYNAKK